MVGVVMVKVAVSWVDVVGVEAKGGHQILTVCCQCRAIRGFGLGSGTNFPVEQMFACCLRAG